MPRVEILKSFNTEEDGAVTVDFAVLAAIVLALGVAVLATVSRGSNDFAGALDDHIKAVEVGVSAPADESGSGGAGGDGEGGSVGGASD
ncbi:hypothetical protein [Celeribacter sp.]|uniref:hypothetical protein n=1 Tax=Celeribacter sp. TaxID=1890673 RepID=UPI003A8DE559